MGSSIHGIRRFFTFEKKFKISISRFSGFNNQRQTILPNAQLNTNGKVKLHYENEMNL